MLYHRSLTLCYPRICAMRLWSASTIAPLNRKEDFLLQLSGPVLYLRSRSLFDAILSLSQSLISGLPHPPAAREHPTYPFSGRLRLRCPHNDKAHVKTVNRESNPNPQNNLNSKTTSIHYPVRYECGHMEKVIAVHFVKNSYLTVTPYKRKTTIHKKNC